MIYFETKYDEETEIRTTKIKIEPIVLKVGLWAVISTILITAFVVLGIYQP